MRPCFDDSLYKFLRNIVDCGGIYSMPSTHAVNHFALAAFWYWIIYLLRGKKWNWLWIWAAMIGYAQIYVGKHYPSDVLVGAFIGYILGTNMAKIFEYVVIVKEYNFLPGSQWKNSKGLTH